ncbi:MAG: DUF58 domain-containing protein [Hyphomicrobiaceae bacterium]
MAEPSGHPKTAETVLSLELDAHALTDALPELLIESSRVAQTVIHGIHGRRKSGPGETFWQFRQYSDGDSRSQIDWRRSGASDHLFIREREWEAAHTVWFWPDVSPSMVFRSSLSPILKRDRGLVLMFALGELLARGGERIGILGAMPPRIGRNMIERMALAVAGWDADGDAPSLPPGEGVGRNSELILIGDFLDPIEVLGPRLEELADKGVGGHLVQIVDPAEETLPYAGRVEFEPLEEGQRVLTDRVEGLRTAYSEKFREHRAALQDLVHRFGWSFLVHHTDRPAEEALITLFARLSGADSDYRQSGAFGGFGEPVEKISGIPLQAKMEVVR